MKVFGFRGSVPVVMERANFGGGRFAELATLAHLTLLVQGAADLASGVRCRVTRCTSAAFLGGLSRCSGPSCVASIDVILQRSSTFREFPKALSNGKAVVCTPPSRFSHEDIESYASTFTSATAHVTPPFPSPLAPVPLAGNSHIRPRLGAPLCP